MATTEVKTCYCGCKAEVRHIYKPGHDARHVSMLLAKITAGEVTLAATKRQLPTDAPVAKLNNAVSNAKARAAAKAEKAKAKARSQDRSVRTHHTDPGRRERPGASHVQELIHG